jgi:hypothetical protein
LLYRRLIGIDRPLGVMAIVGDRGVMRCGAAWLIGALNLRVFVLWPQAAIVRCISIQSRSARSFAAS